MKKLLCITVFFFSYIWVFAQTMKDSAFVSEDNILGSNQVQKNPELQIEVGNIVVYISEGTFAQQIQDVAKRTVTPPYSMTFDLDFFDKAIVILEQLSKEKKEASSEITMLKIWRNHLSFDGNKLLKEEYQRFFRQTEEDYGIPIELIISTEQYELLWLGKVQIQLLKESYGSGKKRVEIPQNSYFMIAMKQPLN
ncbi:TPA: hypothetical protein DIC40_01650 [Patescibacteria group bacterium]|nr:hypothetical protein P148_SR1C00001G0319 [candidate division SR1 bacterium RAAC1_SR1_1]HCY20564.1 hypothetical protein [Candidatus Gracilibacteria bacterium]